MCRLLSRSALALVAVLFMQGATLSTREVPIVDPVFKMTAWTLTAPSNWTVEGTMLPPPSCGDATTPIYKAVSPDGLMGSYFYPRVDWRWGGGSASAPDCLPLTREVRANAYLATMMHVLRVGFIRDVPIPQTSMNAPNTTSNAALNVVGYTLGGRPMQAYLSADVVCSTSEVMGVGTVHRCSAFLRRSFAPASRLAAMRPTFDAMHLRLNQAWMEQWTAVMQQRTRALYAAETDASLRQGALAGAERMREHAAFMSSFDAEGSARTAQFEAGQYAKQSNSDNFVDYIFDCRRAYGNGVRVSSGNCPNRQTF